MSQAFTDRTILVTGGGRGIGAATVDRIRAGGGAVAVFDRNVAGLPPGVFGVPGDVTDSAQVTEAVRLTEAELGGIHALICCAGIFGAPLRTVDVSDQEWASVLTVNATGTFYANRAVLPGMMRRGYGRIVNVASTAGKEGNPTAAAYSAAKAAVMAMTQAIARDVARDGILVNSIAPAAVDTPLMAEFSQDITPDQRAAMVTRIPLGRMGTPEEIARMICLLASDEITFSTGACFDISGGRAPF